VKIAPAVAIAPARNASSAVRVRPTSSTSSAPVSFLVSASQSGTQSTTNTMVRPTIAAAPRDAASFVCTPPVCQPTAHRLSLPDSGAERNRRVRGRLSRSCRRRPPAASLSTSTTSGATTGAITSCAIGIPGSSMGQPGDRCSAPGRAARCRGRRRSGWARSRARSRRRPPGPSAPPAGVVGRGFARDARRDRTWTEASLDRDGSAKGRSCRCRRLRSSRHGRRARRRCQWLRRTLRCRPSP
jgi:hypothetical protein